MERTQTSQIVQDLLKKMVFLTGPRQVGKTWLARRISEQFENPVYLNWDSLLDRKVILGEGWLPSTDLLILDEIHRMPEWKLYLKGVFDTRHSNLRILVTGSASLDFVRQSGLSLAGRFFLHRLLPISVAEALAGVANVGIVQTGGTDPAEAILDRLLERGGFPEPFLAHSGVEAARWRKDYVDGLIREDVLDFERVHDLSAMKTLLTLLRGRVGTPVSYQSLSQDIQVSPNTVKKYIEILEALYVIFRVTPWSDSVSRSLLKSPKFYMYDIALVDSEPGARFENLVAVSLLKHALSQSDTTGSDVALHYIRTKEGREVDFCLARDGRPELLVEAKMAEADISPSLRRFATALGVPGVQLVRHLKHERQEQSIQLRRASGWLAGLEPHAPQPGPHH